MLPTCHHHSRLLIEGTRASVPTLSRAARRRAGRGFPDRESGRGCLQAVSRMFEMGTVVLPAPAPPPTGCSGKESFVGIAVRRRPGGGKKGIRNAEPTRRHTQRKEWKVQGNWETLRPRVRHLRKRRVHLAAAKTTRSTSRHTLSTKSGTNCPCAPRATWLHKRNILARNQRAPAPEGPR
eukprot:gene12299-biopygen22961